MIEFTIKTSAEAEQFLGKVDKKIGILNPMLMKIGVYQVGSIDKNFRAGGRPRKWKDLAPLTKALRRKGRGGGHFAILQDKGRLRGSISAKVYAVSTRNEARIGTNLAKAPLLHFGGMSKGSKIKIPQHRRRITQAWGKPIQPKTITVRSYIMKIGPKRVPAREFVMFQREDITAIESLGLKHLDEAIQ